MTSWDVRSPTFRPSAQNKPGRTTPDGGFGGTPRPALGLPAAVLAGISGARGLSSTDARIPAAALALVSAGLSAALAFLKPELHQQAAHARRGAYLALEVGARFALTQAASREEAVPLTVYRNLLERRRMIIAGQVDELVQRIAVGGGPAEVEAGDEDSGQ